MQNNLWEDVFKDLAKQKSELEDRLVSFVLTDTLLFLPDNPRLKDELMRANQLLGSHFVMSSGFDVSPENISQQRYVKVYLQGTEDFKTVFIYLIAMELRSVLLAILLAENKIDYKQAFDYAFYEEITEQKQWGVLPEIADKHSEIKTRLCELEKWYEKRSLS